MGSLSTMERLPMMTAAVCRAYGPPEVVRIERVPKPAPQAGDVLVQIRTTTVSSADWRIRELTMPRGFGMAARLMFGLTRPRNPILGSECAGVVAALGPGVTQFAVGDAVVAFPGVGLASHAEYRVMPADGRIIAKPKALSFEEAAAMCFGGATALHFLRDAARVRRGERVLVIGASGAVGSAAVQIAKAQGALVDAVTSAANRNLVLGLGAERVIDYAVQDFAAGGPAYDVILDTVGAATPAHGLSALLPGGRLVLIVASLPDMLLSLKPPGGGRRIIVGPAKETRELLETLAAMADAGQFRPVIDGVWPFERIAEAHARVGSGRKRGSVVLTVESDQAAGRVALSPRSQ
jgi:NADPH:quinone reductase-like Zn-dependent oxidoreductase